MTSEPNELPCTPGASKQIPSECLFLAERRVHNLVAALKWSLRCIDTMDDLVRGQLGRSPTASDGYRLARELADGVLVEAGGKIDGKD